MTRHVISIFNVEVKLLKCACALSGAKIWRILAHFQSMIGVICYQAIWQPCLVHHTPFKGDNGPEVKECDDGGKVEDDYGDDNDERTMTMLLTKGTIMKSIKEASQVEMTIICIVNMVKSMNKTMKIKIMKTMFAMYGLSPETRINTICT